MRQAKVLWRGRSILSGSEGELGLQHLRLQGLGIAVQANSREPLSPPLA